MFDPETHAFLPQWKSYKDSQWERIQAKAISGLQLIKSGEGQHQYELVCSLDACEDGPAFYEAVLIGQLPQIVREVAAPRSRIGGKSVRRPAPEERKPVRKRAIDVSDEEITQVLLRWVQRRTAGDLPFIVPGTWRDR